MQNVKQNMEKHLNEMCLGYPTYHAASPGERARADYIEKKFLEYGLKVRREEYKVRGWDFKSFSLSDVTAGREVPYAICEYFSGSIDFEGKLIMVNSTEDPKINEIDVDGKVIFVAHSGGTFQNGDYAEALESRGALGVIMADSYPEGGQPSTKIIRTPYTDKIAAAVVGPIGARYIAANLDHTYRLVINAKPYDTVTDNVIGYVEGDEAKIVFGAHYDSAPNAHGAGDNASGTAMLLEMARLLKDKGNGHTLEFVAFSAEEYCERVGIGAKGSNEYLAIHNGENILWYMNFDDYCVSPVYAVDRLGIGYKEKLPEIDWPLPTIDAILAGDDKPFFDRGYPVIWISQKKEIRILHTLIDSIEFIDYDAMQKGSEMYYDMAVQLLAKS